MIGFLTGRPEIVGDHLLLHVGGIGFEVSVTPATLGLVGQAELSLHIHTHVREDLLELYGFASKEERSLFELLLRVTGVGPRMALNLLALGHGQLRQAVIEADVSLISSIPRVGKKLAQKIIIELKSKLGSDTELDLADQPTNQSEAIQALKSLGFSPTDISQALRSLDSSLPSSVLVKQALQRIQNPAV